MTHCVICMSTESLMSALREILDARQHEDLLSRTGTMTITRHQDVYEIKSIDLKQPESS